MTVHTPHAAKPAHCNGIRAKITDSDQCHAEGYAVHSSAPVLAICRKLIEAGFDPDLPLRAYRGDVLCLTIRSIGEAAYLNINSKGTGFVRCRPAVRIGPPIARQKRALAIPPYPSSSCFWRTARQRP